VFLLGRGHRMLLPYMSEPHVRTYLPDCRSFQAARGYAVLPSRRMYIKTGICMYAKCQNCTFAGLPFVPNCRSRRRLPSHCTYAFPNASRRRCGFAGRRHRHRHRKCLPDLCIWSPCRDSCRRRRRSGVVIRTQWPAVNACTIYATTMHRYMRQNNQNI
jgi:hypothetical protein